MPDQIDPIRVAAFAVVAVLLFLAHRQINEWLGLGQPPVAQVYCATEQDGVPIEPPFCLDATELPEQTPGSPPTYRVLSP